MSTLYTGCTTETLVAVPSSSCLESFAQPTRAYFTKRKNGSALNFIDISTDTDAHQTLATYQALVSAVDDTKLIVTPRFANATMPEPTPRTFGSGNQVPDGVPINLGSAPPTFSSTFYGLTAEQEEAMAKVNGDLAVYLVSSEQQIGGIFDSNASPTKVYPIPIFNLFFSDRQLGGYDGVDANVLSWSFYAGWSRKFNFWKPTDFNPVTDL